MESMKVIFMGTPEFAVPTLSELLKAGYDTVAVYTQPPRPAGRGQKETPSPVHQFALEHQLPVHTPVTLKDEAVQKIFRDHRADVAVVAAYGLLLPQAILEGTRLGCINVHPSLLPRWRGAAPIQRTIMAGDRETGVVIMQMDAGLDTGDMLLVKRLPIPDGMNAGQLHDILSVVAGPMVVETLQALQNGAAAHVKQAEAGATYASKITKEECRINWSDGAEIIRHKILGLSPGPGAFFIYKGEQIKVFDAQLHAGGNYKPGTVMDDNLTIACGEGALTKLQVQRPGKKPMPASEMLKGYPIPEGTVLT